MWRQSYSYSYINRFRFKKDYNRISNGNYSNGKYYNNQYRSNIRLINNNTIISIDNTHHLNSNLLPLYSNKFQLVLSFHEGLAAVIDNNNKSYHINYNGNPIYSNRYIKTYGYYHGLAAVVNELNEYYHIDINGNNAYSNRWLWCGNFIRVLDPNSGINFRCTIRNNDNKYYYIDNSGFIISGPYSYAGDFNNHGQAIIWDLNGKPNLIDSMGKLININYKNKNNNAAIDIHPPHKSIINILDNNGWYYYDLIKKEELIADNQRYKLIEPHYNGQAFVKLNNGIRAIIDQNGSIMVNLPQSIDQSIYDINNLSLEYWNSFALKLAIELKLLEKFKYKHSINILDFKSDIDNNNKWPFNDLKLHQLILRVMIDIGIVKSENSINNNNPEEIETYSLTDKGKLLIYGNNNTNDNNNLFDRAKYWLQDRYLKSWLPTMNFNQLIPVSIKSEFLLDTFNEISTNPDLVKLSQKVLNSYAEKDWNGITALLDIKLNQTIIDLGGGNGALLKEISNNLSLINNSIKLICIDRPEVIKLINNNNNNNNRIQFQVGDLFTGKLPIGELYILSRILHDWDDNCATKILSHLYDEMPNNSEICIIERHSNKINSHSLLSLHMYLLQRSFERTAIEWENLFKKNNFDIIKIIPFNDHFIMRLNKSKSNPIMNIDNNNPIQLQLQSNSELKFNNINPVTLPLRKAIIPLAGLGSRMRPQSIVTPKALLPIIINNESKSELTIEPAIYLLLKDLFYIGSPINEILLILSSKEQLLIIHPLLNSLEFDMNNQLILNYNRSISTNTTVSDHYLNNKIKIIFQSNPNGFGGAILLAEKYINNNEPFLVLLGDHLYNNNCIEQIINSYNKLIKSNNINNNNSNINISLTGACYCNESDINSTGLLRIPNPSPDYNSTNKEYFNDPIEVLEMAEKPNNKELYKSFELINYSLKGKYLSQLGIDILTPVIFDKLREIESNLIKINSTAELNLRSAMSLLINSNSKLNKLLLFKVNGNRYDIGNPVDYWKTLQSIYRSGLKSNLKSSNSNQGQAELEGQDHGQAELDSIRSWLVNYKLLINNKKISLKQFLNPNSDSGESEISISSAPGRIDLMGGFSDYSGGTVLESNIDNRIYSMISKSINNTIEIISINVNSINNTLNSSLIQIPNNNNNYLYKSLPIDILFDSTNNQLLTSIDLLKSRLLNYSLLESRSNSDSIVNNWYYYVIGIIYFLLKEFNNSIRLNNFNGFRIVLLSDLPMNIGLGSSASIEMSIALSAMNIMGFTLKSTESMEIQLSLLCQSVENLIIGAHSGIMDQITISHAKNNSLINFNCGLPLSIAMQSINNISLPVNIKLIGLSSNIKRSISGSAYKNVRIASIMGKLIINQLILNNQYKSNTIINYLTEISLSDFNQYFRNSLPQSINGKEFILIYFNNINEIIKSKIINQSDLNLLSEIDNNSIYLIQSSTVFPIEETFRVNLFTQLIKSNDQFNNYKLLRELMNQSHYGYIQCGLGSNDSNLLVNLINQEIDNQSINNINSLIGAKSTAGGSGGTIAILAINSNQTNQSLDRIREKYNKLTNRNCSIINTTNQLANKMKFHGNIRLLSTSASVSNNNQYNNNNELKSIIDLSINKPKVLLVNHGYPPNFNGGSEVYTQTLAINLLKSGYCKSIEIISREHDAFKPDFVIRTISDQLEPKLKVHLINHAREAPYYRFINEPLENSFKILLNQIKPDIIHFGHLNHLSLNLPKLAKLIIPNVKIIYTLHDFWLMCPRGQFLITGVTKSNTEPWEICDGQNNQKCATRCFAGRYATGNYQNSSTSESASIADSNEINRDEEEYWTKWIDKRMKTVLNNCDYIDAFISPSVHLYKRFIKEFNLPIKKIALIPYGFDRSRLSNRKRSLINNNNNNNKSNPFIFGYIGRHQASKGMHLLIESIIELIKLYPLLSELNQFQLIIFGRTDSSTTPSLIRMINDSNILINNPNIIQWRPEYNNSDIVNTVFNEIDAIVVPSIWDENSPLVIHEAQQCKIPVITSNIGGMGELVKNGINGLIFKHRDSKSLTEILLSAIQQPLGMKYLGERGYIHSIDRQIPSIEQHIIDIMNLYSRLQRNESVNNISNNPINYSSEYAGLLSIASSLMLNNNNTTNCNISIPEPIKSLSSPWRITFDTNPDDCNYHCTMCEQHSEYSPYQKERKLNKVRRRRMDFNIIQSIVAEMANKGLKEIIPSTMGEPLQYKYFINIIELCHQYKIKLNLTTNGSFYGRGPIEWAKLIVPITSDVKISWNGITQLTQESIMKGSNLLNQINNLKSFINIRNEIYNSGGNYCSVTLQLTFMDKNLNEIPDIIKFAIDNGIDRVKGHHLWAHFNEIADQNLRRSNESIMNWNEIVRKSYEIVRQNSNQKLLNGKSIKLENFFELQFNPDLDNNNNVNSINKSISIHPLAICPFLGNEAWINYEGKFNPCCAPDLERAKLGEFGSINPNSDSNNNSLLNIWQSDSYQNLVKNYLNNSLCQGCNMRRPPASASAAATPIP